ncbi:HAD-IIIC family phosphatase [Streptomyces sp. MK7]|uniref:HAD-IIIC family phosphatase n=1 Tax=Streptomyces sp. MK7 TaxID=3067635 RepID=UPI00292FB6F5|nr:HAD-IIIC family phosphatase [Streptomyces sp. MK7]
MQPDRSGVATPLVSRPGATPPGPGATPLQHLRALARSGFGDGASAVAGLLAQLDDVLDLEAAGAVLSGARRREQLAATGLFTAQPIALLGSCTLDTLPPLLTATMLQAGIQPEIRLAGFNQWRFEVLSGAPTFKDLAPRVVACLLDDSAVFAEITDPLDIEEVEARCAAFPAELRQWTQAAQDVLGGLTVLCTLPLSPLRRDRLIDYRSKARLEAAWQRMNAAILDLATELSGTVVLSDAALAARAGTVFGSDRMRHAAAHSYTPEFLHAYAQELTRVARADLGRAAKCLVLDLDNTLWGGVVGDDGIGGLRLGGSYPGSAYQELQTLARDLEKQGVMLAVASKNDEEIAREAIATHPDMVLQPHSFLAVRANWQPKPDNVRELAAELNIGADAMVFVDDNPVERGLMRELLPQVTTVELPADPAGYASCLAGRGDFNLLKLTGEDRERTKLYRERSQRAELQSTAGSLEEYLAALDSRLTIEPADALNTARIAQLFGKTNQFNLTGVRYTEEDIAQRIADGTGTFFAARLTDRFGDNGLIAAIALSEARDGAWSIDNFVLSCRVFSRNVEDAIVGLILRSAEEHSAAAVLARYTRTAKNAKFAGFYPAQGFVPDAAEDDGTSTGFRHDLTSISDLPDGIRVVNDEGVFHVR